jgi:hypothetical protein
MALAILPKVYVSIDHKICHLYCKSLIFAEGVVLWLPITNSNRTRTSGILFFFLWTFFAKFVLFKMISQQKMLTCQKTDNKSMVNKACIIVAIRKKHT